MNPSKLIIPIMLLVSITSMAGCTTSPTTTATVTSLPTQTLVPATLTPTNTPALPTNTPEPTFTPTPPMFFTNNFETISMDWTHFSVNGENSVLNKDNLGINLSVDEGFWVYNIEKDLEWIYSIYDVSIYSDVRIDAVVANRGTNNNNISLICRYSEENGWYEFNISNSGYFYIYHALARFDGFVSYTGLGEGGSNDIKQGAETNIYSAVCQGDTLTLLINDIKVKEVKTGQSDLSKGKLGISVSSFLQVPVKVKFDTITISQP